MQAMAQRSTSKLQKTSQRLRDPQQVQDDTDVEESNVGENAAPDNPSHLMPSVQANGGGASTDDPKERDLGPDLSPTELADLGYPNPETTPDEGMKSTRQGDETSVEAARRNVSLAHKVLDDKLDSISAEHENRKTLLEMSVAEEVDYANLPNAPKGDVLILGPDEPLRVSGDEQGGVIVLDKPVYRARRPFRSLRWTFTLEYSAGSHLPVSKVRSVPKPINKPEESGTEETK